jgi:hypothetical protein
MRPTVTHERSAEASPSRRRPVESRAVEPAHHARPALPAALHTGVAERRRAIDALQRALGNRVVRELLTGELAVRRGGGPAEVKAEAAAPIERASQIAGGARRHTDRDAADMATAHRARAFTYRRELDQSSFGIGPAQASAASHQTGVGERPPPQRSGAARQSGASTPLADPSRLTVSADSGVYASLRRTLRSDRTETQATRFASTGKWLAPVTPGGAVPISASSLRAVLAAIAGPGNPLDTQLRLQLEPELGLDLGHVRVHTHPAALASARALGAKAYTVGAHVVFAPGQYQPETGAGRELLAHELAHVAQQAASGAPVMAAEPDNGFWDVLDVVSPGTGTLGRSLGLSSTDVLEAGARFVLGDTLWSILHEFILGFQEGLEKAPQEQTQRVSDKFAGFDLEDAYSYAEGFAKGVLEGLWDALKGLVKAVITLIQLPGVISEFLRKFPELAARYGPRLAQFMTESGGLSDQLDKLRDAFLKDPQMLARIIEAARAAGLARVRAGGRGAAATFLGFLTKPWDEIGEEIGEIVGQILFEVLLAVGTDLIGNIVKEAAALIGRVTGRVLEGAVRVVEGVADALRTVGRLIDHVVEWVQAIGRRLTGAAGELFESLKALLGRLRAFFASLAEEAVLADTGVGGVKISVQEIKGATRLESRALEPPARTSPATVADLAPPRVHETPTGAGSVASAEAGQLAMTGESLAAELELARDFYPSHRGQVGSLLAPGRRPMRIKSGVEGGPWGGTQRGGIPRGKGYAFTSGGPSQGNIATHVEGHTAAIMHQSSIKKATLVMGAEQCQICARNLPTALPAGSELTVINIDSAGNVLSSNTYRSSHAF